MSREALAGRLCEGLEEAHVVLRGCDGHMSHVGREGGKLGLHIDPGLVPAKQRSNGERVAGVVDAG
jgi:hypothetical protein